jgi:hypothetical protein
MDKTVIWLGASDKTSEGIWKWNYGETFWSDRDPYGQESIVHTNC